jgi:uncharacterized protein (TIGR03067 family)
MMAVAVASLLTVGAATQGKDSTTQPPSVADQSKQLQGKWEGAEIGREAEGKCLLTIKSNTIHFQGANNQEWYKTTFTLVPGTDPKQLRATITDCPQPEYVGKVVLSIYKLEGGTLTLAGNEPGAPEAPKTFEGDKDSRRFIFKKAQEKEKAEPREAK